MMHTWASTPDGHTADPAATSNIMVEWGIAAVAAILCGGILLSAIALPLSWLPGQLLVTVVLLLALPLTMVRLFQGRMQLSGMAADSYRRRGTIGLLAAAALLLVAVPAYTWQLLGHGSNLASVQFIAPVVLGVGLCWCASAMTGSMLTSWKMLHEQDWESGERAANIGAWGGGVVEERGERVNRTMILRRLWLRWTIGGLILALALLGSTFLPADGEQLAVPWGVLALVIYAGLGLLLLGQAARVGRTTEWQLDRLTLAPEVAGQWGRAAAIVVIIAVGAVGILLALHLLDVIHGAVTWFVDAVLLNILSWILSFISNRPPSAADLQNQLHTIVKPPAQPRPRIAPPQAHSGGTAGIWLWLAHAWPCLLGAIALAVVATTYWQARKQDKRGGPWWGMLAIVARELRAILASLWRPMRQILAQATAEARRTATAALGRRPRRRRLDGLGPRETIIALYGDALDTAARRGYARRPGETPGEYASELAEQLPPAREPLGPMTETFVTARYSRPLAEAEEGEVRRMRDLWSELRNVLRQNKNRG